MGVTDTIVERGSLSRLEELFGLFLESLTWGLKIPKPDDEDLAGGGDA